MIAMDRLYERICVSTSSMYAHTCRLYVVQNIWAWTMHSRARTRMCVAGSAAEVWARERERVGPDRRVMGAMSHQRAISAGEAHIHPTVTK